MFSRARESIVRQKNRPTNKKLAEKKRERESECVREREKEKKGRKTREMNEKK